MMFQDLIESITLAENDMVQASHHYDQAKLSLIMSEAIAREKLRIIFPKANVSRQKIELRTGESQSG